MNNLPILKPSNGGGLGGIPKSTATSASSGKLLEIISSDTYIPTNVYIDRNNYPMLKDINIPNETTSTSLASSTHVTDIYVSFQKILFGNGVFLNVVWQQSGSLLLYSSFTGSNLWWTQRSASISGFPVIGAAYGNGIFVIASNNTAYTTSPDGITWTTRTVTSGTEHLYFANGRFIAFDSPSATTFRYSTDGINWTNGTKPATAAQQTSLTYGNGLFLTTCASSTGTKYLTSPDGITWTVRTPPNESRWESALFVDGTFYITNTSNGSQYATSTDGINWTTRSYPSVNDGRFLSYYNGLFIATASSGGTWHKSTDGINWVSLANPYPSNTSFTYLVNNAPATGLGLFVVPINATSPSIMLGTLSMTSTTNGLNQFIYIKGIKNQIVRIKK